MLAQINKTRTAIITGASYGIGYHLAVKMAEEGYDLGLMARSGDLLEELAHKIKSTHPEQRVFIQACDITDTESCRKTIQELAKQLGSLNVFVANAGIGASTPAWKENWRLVKHILEVNILGTIASIEAAKEIMLQQKSGHVVGLSSVAAFRGLPASGAYCTSKAALMTYLESLRVDLQPFGISVTSIHPGYVDTPMTQSNPHMPLLLSVEKAISIIFRSIQKKRARVVFPWPLKFAVWILQVMPDRLYDFLIRLRTRKGVFKD